MKNCSETSNNFIEKFQRNSEEILEICGALLKIYPGVLGSLSDTRNFLLLMGLGYRADLNTLLACPCGGLRTFLRRAE